VVDAAARGHVHQQSPRDDLRQRVDAQPVGAVVLDDVGQREAVVRAVADLQVVESVQVGAHLLGRRDLLDDPVDAVVAEAVRAGVRPAPVDLVGVRGQVLAEGPAGEGRDVRVENVRQVVHLAVADEPDRLEDLGRGDLVERARLVVRAVARRPPAVHGEAPDRRPGGGRRRAHSLDQVVSKEGKRVSPPSTKTVWPVM
jgi:hypothetical protein